MVVSFSRFIGKTVSNRVFVATEKECRIASLQRNGESLEELLDLQIGREALSRRAVSGDRLQGFDGRSIPATKCLHNEGLEEKPGSSAVDGVFPHLFVFAHLDGGSGVSGGPVNDRVLSW